MAVQVKDILKLFIAEASFLAASKRRQMGFDTTTKRALLHDDSTDTLAWAVSDDSLQCLLAGIQTITGAKTFSADLTLTSTLSIGETTGATANIDLRSTDTGSQLINFKNVAGTVIAKIYHALGDDTLSINVDGDVIDVYSTGVDIHQDLLVNANVQATGNIKSSGATGGVGYRTGAGGAVTQATNRTTGVALNKMCGAITTNNTSLAAGAAATFTVTAAAIDITDTVNVTIRSGATTNQTRVEANGVTASSFDITVENNHASTAETGAIIINYSIIKAVAS